MNIRTLTLVTTLCSVLSARADVPTSINYQGVVQVDGTDFSGTGLFKFALVTDSPRGDLTRWSHDGTSFLGSAPGSSIKLPVNGGLFTIGLGDTAVPNMTEPIDPADIDHTGVLLRVWFSDGVNGFSQLLPDRPLRAVPYALQAASLADGAISGDQIAPDSIGSEQIAGDLSLTDLDLGNLSADGDLRLLGRYTGGGFVDPNAEFERVRLYADAPGTLVPTSTLGGGLDLFDESETRRVSLRAEGALLSLTESDGDTGLFMRGDTLSGGGQLTILNGSGMTTVQALGSQGEVVTTTQIGVGNSVGDPALKAALAKSDNGGTLHLRDASGDITAELQAVTNGSNGGRLQLREADGTLTVRMGAEGSGGGGFLSLRDGDGNIVIELDASDGGSGVTRTQVLEITGGSDLSEKFDIAPAAQSDTPPTPGALVCIDPDQPGALVTSSRSYDRTVAGVISGAGGVNPGMLMGQRGSIADGRQPVALTGRVYCQVDASFGSIEPGDLITTSDTPGYGMRVDDHDRAAGAVIGKAMTRLDSGRGLVLVLVSLQ